MTQTTPPPAGYPSYPQPAGPQLRPPASHSTPPAGSPGLPGQQGQPSQPGYPSAGGYAATTQPASGYPSAGGYPTPPPLAGGYPAMMPPAGGHSAPPPVGGYLAPPPPPPAAPNGAPLASFWERLLAYLIDAVILSVVVIVVTLPVAIACFVYLLDSTTTADPYAGDTATAFVPLAIVGLVTLVVFVLALAISYLYLVELMFRSGQTVGKRAMKLRVVPLDPAAQLTRGIAAKRFLIQNVVAGLVPLFSYVDGLWQLWDQPYRQCLHDKFAKTVVVKI